MFNPIKRNKFLELNDAIWDARGEITHITDRGDKHISAKHVKDFVIKLDPLYADFSKNIISTESLIEICCKLDEAGLQEAIDSMMNKDKINFTEDREATHIHNRILSLQETKDHYDKMFKLVDKIYASSSSMGGRSILPTKMPIRHIVNIGVGGSDLGSKMAVEALTHYKSDANDIVSFHFVSGLDGDDIHSVIDNPYINLNQTLFIVSSKTFTTYETLKNAEIARKAIPFLNNDDSYAKQHFIGISNNTRAMSEWGILPENQLYIPESIGGRYSISSAMALPLALYIGPAAFKQFLSGMNKMDNHFINSDFENNIPVIAAILSKIYSCHEPSPLCILPYTSRMKLFPHYIQQLSMESLGKYKVFGENIDSDEVWAGEVVFGEVGTNAQHSFMQFIHQSQIPVQVDFISPINSKYEENTLSLSHCISQSEALWQGSGNREENNYHRGLKPSNTFLVDEMNPEALGMLIAMYEHKVFVQAYMEGINPFDQPGVELGKKMSKDLEGVLEGLKSITRDQYSQSTMKQINHIKKKLNTKK